MTIYFKKYPKSWSQNDLPVMLSKPAADLNSWITFISMTTRNINLGWIFRVWHHPNIGRHLAILGETPQYLCLSVFLIQYFLQKEINHPKSRISTSKKERSSMESLVSNNQVQCRSWYPGSIDILTVCDEWLPSLVRPWANQTPKKLVCNLKMVAWKGSRFSISKPSIPQVDFF